MDKKIFKVNGVAYRLTKASDETLKKSEGVYSSKIAELIAGSRKDGSKPILFRSQLDDFLMEQGIWSEKQAKELSDLEVKYDSLQKKLNNGGIKLSGGRKIAVEMFEITKKRINLQVSRREFDDSTVESMAEKEQREYLIFDSLIKEANAHPVWNTFEDLLSGENADVLSEANNQFYVLMSGSDQDFISSQPEIEWMRKFGYLDKELSLIDRKTKKPVDLHGNPIKEQNKKEIKSKPFIDDETGEPVKLK